MQVRNEGHKSIITYRVSVQTNSILPISPYMIEFFLVQIRDDDKSLLCHNAGGNNNAYFEVSQLLRCQPKHGAMIGLWFTRDGDIRRHVHRAVTGADIAVLTHHGGCVRLRG